VEPTVTDCALLLGYIDPAFFLGGAMRLDLDAAGHALESRVASPLGLGLEEAAAAVLSLATEKMVGAIEEITINQGIDPRSAALIGGGGAAGLNAVAVARRLGCREVVIPEVGAALSAAGALMSDLSAEYSRMAFATSDRFDADAINQMLTDLEQQCREFIAGPGEGSLEQRIDYTVEARYPHQIWEIEVPMAAGHFRGPEDVRALVASFHATHKQIFEISDPQSEIELVTWRARVRCRLRERGTGRLVGNAPAAQIGGTRRVYFADGGWVEATVKRFEEVAPDTTVTGPAIIESSFTTVVLDPGAVARRTAAGSLVIAA
jgi:N-methylhydantoinase A